MAYIYQIINKVNGKSYIGQTKYSIQERFKEHIKDSKRFFNNRPIYSAFNKYGIENFEIILLEETKNPDEREIFYINKFKSYVGFENSNGYNATLGGDGKKTIQFSDEEVIEKYQELNYIDKTSESLGICKKTIRKILVEHNIPIKWHYNNVQFSKKTVYFEDKLGNKKEFESVIAAANWLVENNLTQASVNSARVSIGRAISGKRKSYLGLNWFKLQ